MLGLTFSSKLDCDSYINSMAKPSSNKIGALIPSMKFLSPEAALYLYKCTIHPCMEYFCHVWAGVLSCYLKLLDKLQKQICWTVGASFAGSLEPLAYHRNMASLSLLQVLLWQMFFRAGSTCSTSFVSRKVYLLF